MEDIVLNKLRKKDFFAKEDNFTADKEVESVLMWAIAAKKSDMIGKVLE